MTAKVMKIRQDKEIVCYASDIRDDDSLIYVISIEKLVLWAASPKLSCNEHDLHSDYEVGGILQLVSNAVFRKYFVDKSASSH